MLKTMHKVNVFIQISCKYKAKETKLNKKGKYLVFYISFKGKRNIQVNTQDTLHRFGQVKYLSVDAIVLPEQCTVVVHKLKQSSMCDTRFKEIKLIGSIM